MFTITWGGITTGTASYTLNDTSTNYENTSQLAVGTHTLKCTANKNNGTSANASVTITVNAPKPAYTKVEYTTPGTYTWTVPEGVTTVKVTVAGAGGGGRRGLL